VEGLITFLCTNKFEMFIAPSNSNADWFADPTRLATEVVGMGDRWARFGQTRAVDWHRGHDTRMEKGVRLGLPKGSQQQICCFLLNSNNQCLQSIYPLLKIL
jgi:hypothetical protein